MAALVLVGGACAATELPLFRMAPPIAPASRGALPLLPSGERVLIDEGALRDYSQLGLGGRTWPSAATLCRWLADEGVLDGDESVLELGCGVGAVGCFAAALEARRVTLTDGGSAALLQLAQRNVEANEPLWTGRASVRVLPLQWGGDVAKSIGVHTWIIGSDVTYSRESHGALCDTIAAQLSATDGSRCVLAHEHRALALGSFQGADERLGHFAKTAESRKLQLSILRTEQQRERDVSVVEVGLM